MVSDAEEMDITEWLQADENDQGYAHLDDQEIVEFVATEHGDDTCNNDDEDNDDDDDEVQVQPCRVSHAEAAVCADKLLIWLQKQDECNTYNFNVLQGLRDIAAKKRFSSMKQTLLTSFTGNKD